MAVRRTYTELIQLDTFEERYRYLRLNGEVCGMTFGHRRALNQKFYQSYQWKRARRQVLIRDDNCDLAMPGHDIPSGLHIHHMNPVTIDDLMDGNPEVLDPEYLISTTQATHNAIHYGDEKQLPRLLNERRPGDTWI